MAIIKISILPHLMGEEETTENAEVVLFTIADL